MKEGRERGSGDIIPLIALSSLLHEKRDGGLMAMLAGPVKRSIALLQRK